MHKIFYILVESVFWLLLVISKVLLFLLITIILGTFIDFNLWIHLSIISLGVLYGIFYAERIRKKYGCSIYWSKIYSTPDITPENENSKNSENKSSE